jgi:cytochrome c553
MPLRLPRGLIALVLAAAAPATETPPPWAYGFKEPPPPNTPQAAASRIAVPPTDPTHYGLADSELTFTRSEITNVFGPADYFPREHPTPPLIVSHGRPPTIWACARCHYANGKGRPENADLAGLPVDYFIKQMEAFRAGKRASSDPRKTNTPAMVEYAKTMTDEEIREAAEYYGAMKWTPWIRVVETDVVPVTTTAAMMYLQVPGGGEEPIGERIIEVPEDTELVEIQRSPHVGFIAYAPVGSVRRGEELVTHGGGKTLACAACHGADLGGMNLPEIGGVPGLAGRSASYLFRQLFDMKNGKRHGTGVEPMKPVAANLESADMLAISAYLASLKP